MVLLAVLLFSSVLLAPSASGNSHDQHPETSLPPAPSSVPELELARKLIAAGDYQKALETLTQVKSRSPKTPGLNREFGMAYYRSGNLSQAIDSLRQALVESPNDHEMQQLLGLSYFQLGKPAEAIPLLESVRSILPAGNVDSSYALGLCYLRIKE